MRRTIFLLAVITLSGFLFVNNMKAAFLFDESFFDEPILSTSSASNTNTSSTITEIISVVVSSTPTYINTTTPSVVSLVTVTTTDDVVFTKEEIISLATTSTVTFSSSINTSTNSTSTYWQSVKIDDIISTSTTGTEQIKFSTNSTTENKSEIIQTVVQKEVKEEAVPSSSSKKEVVIKEKINECEDCELTGNVILNAIYPNPIGKDTEGEYISIKNLSDNTIDLSNWKISDLSKEYKLSGIIQYNQIIIWPRSSTSIALNNTKPEEVKLIDSSNNLIDKVGYNKAPEGKIYTLNNKEWSWIDGFGVGGQIITSTKEEMVSIPHKVTTTVQNIINASTTIITATSTENLKNKTDEEDYISLSLSQARQADKGEKVKVSGTVSVLPNIFGSQYIYITDNGAGIQIYSYKKEFPDLSIGYHIEVVGEMSSAFGIPRIKIKKIEDIKIISSKRILPVVSTTISGLNENHLGSLVKITGMITELKSNYMYIDDGRDEMKIYFKPNTNIKKSNYTIGASVTVVGIFEKAGDGWHVMPRNSKDITILQIKKEKDTKKENKEIVVTTTLNIAEEKNIKYLWITIITLAFVILSTLFIKRKALFNKQKTPQVLV